MAKKQLVAGPQSKYDGRLLTLIGTGLLMLLVEVIFIAIAFAVPIALGVIQIDVEAIAISVNQEADLLMLILSLVSLILFPIIGGCWSMIIFTKWDTRHTVISGQRLKFTANTWSLFWNCMKWLFLTAITLGIYGLWWFIKFRKWQVKHIVALPEVVEGENCNYYAPSEDTDDLDDYDDYDDYYDYDDED